MRLTSIYVVNHSTYMVTSEDICYMTANVLCIYAPFTIIRVAYDSKPCVYVYAGLSAYMEYS